METYVGSDFHFNHDNIIGFCDRPFDDISTMNQTMIEQWRQVVGPKDRVFVPGDFAYKARREGHIPIEEIVAQLTGEIHLILGNHDLEFNLHKMSCWASVQHYLELKIDKQRRFVMSHYPFETWRNAQHGWIMLHGHNHGTLKRVIPHRFDVGVDATGVFAPLPLEHFFQLAQDQVLDPQDHHGE